MKNPLAIKLAINNYPKATVIPVGANMSDGRSIAKMVMTVMDQLGAINIMVNKAGVTAAMPILDMTDENFDSLMVINLSGPF